MIDSSMVRLIPLLVYPSRTTSLVCILYIQNVTNYPGMYFLQNKMNLVIVGSSATTAAFVALVENDVRAFFPAITETVTVDFS